jgi:hypothetical protein
MIFECRKCVRLQNINNGTPRDAEGESFTLFLSHFSAFAPLRGLEMIERKAMRIMDVTA